MRKTMLVLTAALCAAVMFHGAAARAEGTKIAVIDVGRILNESDAGKAAKKKLEARYEELRKQVEARKDEAQKIKDDLDKTKVLMDREKGKARVREKEEALAAKLNEYQKAAQEAEKEMQSRQGELGREILKVIEAQVNRVIADEKIDLLLDATQGNGVLHVSPPLDITPRVLEMVNKEKPATSEGGGKTGGK